MKRKMMYLAITAVILMAGTTVWAMTGRTGYESAEYKVIEKDGNIEVREYPDLTLVATSSKMDTQGRDGSFMRLFRYISGENEAKQKIAMTTPVFMEGEIGDADMSMGFVVPKQVAADGAPNPMAEGVEIRTRKGGRFAAIRFSGQLNSKLAKQQEEKLREWMKSRDIEGDATAEAAGYDAPFVPAMLRRNEVLVRISQPVEADADLKSDTKDITADDEPA